LSRGSILSGLPAEWNVPDTADSMPLAVGNRLGRMIRANDDAERSDEEEWRK
jgi:hypothetical protein